MSIIDDKNMILELGDIIQISAPFNEELNNKIFLIDFINNKIIKLINDETLDTVTLNVIDNKITDESIISIAVLDKADEKGYARQNGLLPGVWIDVHFGGDVPVVITGEIINIERDMIEINMYPSNDKIYFDFGYKGIDYDILPIDKINIREKPPKEFITSDDADLSMIREGDEESEVDDEYDISKESDEDENVIDFMEDGKRYQRDEDNLVFDVENMELIGEYNTETGRIERYEEGDIDRTDEEYSKTISQVLPTLDTQQGDEKIVEFIEDGRTYQRNMNDPDNLVYDIENNNVIGVYNTKTKRIDKYDSPTGELRDSSIKTGSPVTTSIPVKKIREQIQDVLTEADEIIFGDDIEEIQQEVFVDDKYKRYSLNEQTNDLLDEMLSTIPNINRTKSVLNNIHLMINRFTELRRQYSEFDINGNVIQSIKHGNNYKPLVEQLYKLNANLYWLLPVVRNRVKLYDVKMNDDDSEEIITIDNYDDLSQIQELQASFKNGSMEGTDNYGKYIKSLNPYFTPYNNPINEDDTIISNVPVKKDMNVIINNIISNLNEFYSSVNRNDIIKRQRFVISKYNIGLNRLKMTDIKGSNLQMDVSQLTEADKIPIKSFLALPEPYILYSKIQLPSSSIYNKTNLNHTPLAYWKLLRKSTSITKKEVKDINKDINYDINTFLSEINDLVLNEEINGDDKYKKFLQSIIPKTDNLFELVKKYITRGTSFHNVISYLEAFGIYREDISFKQYQLIVEFVNNQIDRVKLNIAQNVKDTNILRELKSRVEFTSTTFMRLLNDKMGEISNLYQLQTSDNNKITSGDFLSKIMNADQGRYYFSSVSLKNVDLINDFNIKSIIDDKIDDLTDEVITKNEENLCKKYVLAKKYDTIEDLNEDDNNTEVYFDKKYDDTYYDILEEYEQEQKSMSHDDFVSFLSDTLAGSMNLDDRSAFYEANTIITGKKKVIDGQYAVLEDNDKLMSGDNNYRYYYYRSNNKWILDNKLTNETNTDESSIFCNVRSNCIKMKVENSQCDDNEITKDKFAKSNLEYISKSIITENIESQREVRNKLQLVFDREMKRITPLIEYNKSRFSKANNILYKIGQDLEIVDSIISPYSSLRDIILSKTDIVERSTYIIKFCDIYTRPAQEDDDEDTYWFYCVKTNTKLLPTFFLEIAEAFKFGADMNYILDKICAERGEISDDGDKWVDKHSGYTIKMIAYSSDEGYDESGFKIKSNEVIDSDIGSETIEELEKKEDSELLNTPQALIVKRVLTAISFYIGIDMKEYMNFIIRNVTLYSAKLMPSKKIYDRQVYVANKKGKKMIGYEQKYNQYLLFFTGLYLLISIQTSIPGIRTKKTFPGCKKSFDGFPTFSGSGNSKDDKTVDIDYTGLEYISCVMKKITSSQSPWNAIKGISEASLTKNLTTIFNKVLSKDNEIQQRINDKLIYIQEGHEDDFIPEYAQLERWNTFLPPIQPIDLPRTRGLTPEFKSELKRDLKTGNKRQYDKLHIIQGKMIYFTFYIMDEINNIVKSEPALLETMGGEPFIQNVCCNDEKNQQVIHYFTNKNSDINNHIDTIRNLERVYSSIKELSKSPILFSNENTKTIYPPLPDEFGETTIYQAFIKYCKINKGVKVPGYLQQFCVDNESEFKETDSLKEKIEILKKEGKEYSQETLYKMIKVIGKENIKQLNLSKKIHTNIDILEKILEHMDNTDSNFSPNMREYLKDLIDSFDFLKQTHSSKMKDLRNYLITSTQSMKNNIKTFISDNINLPISKKNKLLNSLNEIMEFKELQGDELLSGKELTVVQSTQFIQNMIEDIVTIIPTMILNNISYKNVNIPKHWNLSLLHQSDIKTFIKKDYENLEQLYGKNILKPIFRLIQENAKDVLLMMKGLVLNSTIKLHGKDYQSLLNAQLLKELYHYLLLDVLSKYVELEYITEEYSMATVSNLSEQGDLVDDSTEDGIVGKDMSDLINNGDRLKLKRNIAELLGVFIELMERQKKRINYDRKDIIDLVLRSREKEKDIKTRQLKDLTDEERKADGELRKGKLGRWNIGLQKGLTQYVKGTYDGERAEMEQEAIIDFRLGEISDVTDMNRDIYSMDMLDNEMTERQIESEAMDMSLLPDDDDYGEREGDEQFY